MVLLFDPVICVNKWGSKRNNIPAVISTKYFDWLKCVWSPKHMQLGGIYVSGVFGIYVFLKDPCKLKSSSAGSKASHLGLGWQVRISWRVGIRKGFPQMGIQTRVATVLTTYLPVCGWQRNLFEKMHFSKFPNEPKHWVLEPAHQVGSIIFAWGIALKRSMSQRRAWGKCIGTFRAGSHPLGNVSSSWSGISILSL